MSGKRSNLLSFKKAGDLAVISKALEAGFYTSAKRQALACCERYGEELFNVEQKMLISIAIFADTTSPSHEDAEEKRRASRLWREATLNLPPRLYDVAIQFGSQLVSIYCSRENAGKLDAARAFETLKYIEQYIQGNDSRHAVYNDAYEKYTELMEQFKPGYEQPAAKIYQFTLPPE